MRTKGQHVLVYALLLQEMDINLDVEYTGKCEMAIDADLVREGGLLL